MNRLYLFIYLLAISLQSSAQQTGAYTTLPILYIASGAHARAMGEISAVSAGMYTTSGIIYNPALLVRAKEYVGLVTNYSPFNYYNEGSFLANVGFMYCTDSLNAFSYSYDHFHIGPVQFENNDGIYAKPLQYFHRLRYAHLFSNNMAGGLGIKLIHSNLGPGLVTPFNTFTLDLGLHYSKAFPQNDYFTLNYNTGIQLQDLGPQVNHKENITNKGDNPPTMLIGGLMLGTIYERNNEQIFAFDVAYQLEGILYNTPSIYSHGSEGWLDEIRKGSSTDMPPIYGYFGSFGQRNDSSELQTPLWAHKTGAECRFNYKNDYFFAINGGYLTEFETKGGAKYYTFGASIGLFGFRLQITRQFINKHGVDSIGLEYSRNLRKRTSKFLE